MTNSLNKLFERLLENESIFKDKEVLRHSYTPDVLVHRDEQTEELATILVSALPRRNTVKYSHLRKNRNRENGCNALRRQRARKYE